MPVAAIVNAAVGSNGNQQVAGKTVSGSARNDPEWNAGAGYSARGTVNGAVAAPRDHQIALPRRLARETKRDRRACRDADVGFVS
jgi:hypothetical protein